MRLVINVKTWLESNEHTHAGPYDFEDWEYTGIPSAYDGPKIRFTWVSTASKWAVSLYNEDGTFWKNVFADDFSDYFRNEIRIEGEPNGAFLAYSKYLLDNGFVNLTNIVGSTNILLFRLNDETDKITKSLDQITTIGGTFKSAVGITSFQFEVVGFSLSRPYNYAYIPLFKRYYYIDDVTFADKDHTTLTLREDVLMSHATLIRNQDAFITRYEASTEVGLVDERLPMADVPLIAYYSPTPTTGASLVSFKYKMDMEASPSTRHKPNILVTTVSNVRGSFSDREQDAPTGSQLPDVGSQSPIHAHHYLLSMEEYEDLLVASMRDDATASYVQSTLLLPFDLLDIFPDASTYGRPDYLYIGINKVLDDAHFVNYEPYPAEFDSFYFTVKGESPYIMVADFSFNSVGGITTFADWRDYSPYTQWEIFLPFVGWVTLDGKQVVNKRIWVYYTFDFDTGISTAYIYNKTDEAVIWSGGCQIGLKIPLVFTNSLENAKQKQNNALNLTMGLLTSALTIGGGALTGNVLAIAGGVLNAGKTIASSVNGLNMLMDKAQTGIGSSDNALYAPDKITIRRTYRQVVSSSPHERTIYKHINGLPYRRYANLFYFDVGNYIEVGEIHFDAKGYDIYQSEIDEIVTLLKQGVII